MRIYSWTGVQNLKKVAIMMRAWLVLAILVLFFNDGGHATLSGNNVCSDQVATNLTRELADSRKIVVDSMLNTFTGLTPDKTSLRAVYEAFTKKFARNVTESGYCNFVESLNMISSYYHEASFDRKHPVPNNITTLAQRFELAFGTKNSVEMCNMFAKLLNIKDGEKSSRKSRDAEDCSCPKGGIHSKELLFPCQFFNCLDDRRNLPHIFQGFVGYECLAFVLDTTGSMKDEIDTTIQVIRDMISSEENGCYILVPFNDDGTSGSSVGPVTLTYVDDADPGSIRSLQTLIYNLENSFRKDSGGDCPEYCYDGIIEALEIDDDGFGVMTHGSQVVVVTDAPSKGLNNATDVIKQANDVGVCIHFFLGRNTFNCFETTPDAQGEYERVAGETGGVVVSSKFDFTSFVQKYRSTPCGFLDMPSRKRSTTAQFCHNFTVSSLCCILSVTIKTTEDTVTVTKPNRERVPVNARGDYEEKIALFADNHPQPGQWRVCGDNPIEISVEDQKCIDITPYYIKNENCQPILTAETSPGCTNAHIVLISARSIDINSPVLEMVDLRGCVAARASLLSCGDSMSANITMPPTGTYYYRLEGEDMQGMQISHLIQRKISIPSGAQHYSLTSAGPESVKAQVGQVVNLEFELNSTNDFGPISVNFEIDGDIQHTVVPSRALLSHKEAVRVVVTIRPGVPQQEVTLRAFNDCFNMRARRVVRTTQPVTTAPVPEACNPTCLNGGTCISLRRRLRLFHLCRCIPGYRGRACERQV